MEPTGDNPRYESVEFDAWKCGPYYHRSAEPNTWRALLEEWVVLSDIFANSLRRIESFF